jgi:hypothetical protein
MSEAFERESTVGEHAVVTLLQDDGRFRTEVQKREEGIWARVSRPVVSATNEEARALHDDLAERLEIGALPVNELLEIGVAREWTQGVEPGVGAEQLRRFMGVSRETADRLMTTLRGRIGSDTHHLAIRREYSAITGGFGDSQFWWEVHSVPGSGA